jgi:hypothetical protein
VFKPFILLIPLIFTNGSTVQSITKIGSKASKSTVTTVSTVFFTHTSINGFQRLPTVATVRNGWEDLKGLERVTSFNNNMWRPIC